MTTPLPMTFVTPGVRIPDGIRCSANFCPSGSTTVWPALLPPWYRTTHCTRSPYRSVALPLPSSPHWAPMSTITDMAHSSSVSRVSFHAAEGAPPGRAPIEG